jgi:5-methyltetrahydrofolate--homocysteine methyltransferase
MSEIIDRIAYCIEFGKISKESPYPPDMRGMEGADELTRKALEEGTSPDSILYEGMVVGMERVGKKFSEHKVFVPQMLLSAKAMTSAMRHLKPYIQSGAVKHKGTVIIGTVAGDLHDIGKNLVAMMLEGAGWHVVDLGVDVSADRFVAALKENPGSHVGLSALLTTTMVNMEKTVQDIRKTAADCRILIGGAPVTDNFCKQIGADFYAPDPQGAVRYLNHQVA